MIGTVPTVVTGQVPTTVSGAQVLTTGAVPSVVQAHTATGQATVQKGKSSFITVNNDYYIKKKVSTSYQV